MGVNLGLFILLEAVAIWTACVVLILAIAWVTRDRR